MVSASLRRAWQAIVNPTVRLKADFPWKLGMSAKTYGVALIYYFLGTFLSALAVMGAVLLLAFIDPTLPQWIMEEHYGTFLVAASVVSFLCGFGAEVWYLSSRLKKDGLSFRKLTGLNLDSLNGSKWSAIWRGALTWVLIYLADRLVSLIPMPPQHDPAAEFLQSLTGWPLGIMVLLVVTGVIFEEIVFRGFLMNMLRSSLRQKGKVSGFAADAIAITVSAAAFALMHFNLSGFLAYFVAGVILAESYRRSGSLYVPIVAHFINNAIAAAIVLSSLLS